MAKIEKNIMVVFSGNGEESCWAINENAYDQIRHNFLIDDLYSDIKGMEINHYVKTKDGGRFYNIFPTDIIKLFPTENKKLKGFRAKIILEPIITEELEEGWYE
jgi:hypothetical protein